MTNIQGCTCDSAARIRELETELTAHKEAVRVLANTVVAMRDQRNYENKNNLVPGGAVSSSMEVWAVRVLNNPIAKAAIEGSSHAQG